MEPLKSVACRPPHRKARPDHQPILVLISPREWCARRYIAAGRGQITSLPQGEQPPALRAGWEPAVPTAVWSWAWVKAMEW